MTRDDQTNLTDLRKGLLKLAARALALRKAARAAVADMTDDQVRATLTFIETGMDALDDVEGML